MRSLLKIAGVVVVTVNAFQTDPEYEPKFNIVVNDSLGIDTVFLTDLIKHGPVIGSFILDYGLRVNSNGDFGSDPQPGWVVDALEERFHHVSNGGYETPVSQAGIDEGYRLTITKEFVKNATGPDGAKVVANFASSMWYIQDLYRTAFIELYLGELGKKELENFPDFRSVKFEDRSSFSKRAYHGLLSGGQLQISFPMQFASSLTKFFSSYGGFESCGVMQGKTASAINLLDFYKGEDEQTAGLGEKGLKFLSTCKRGLQFISLSNEIPRGNELVCYYRRSASLSALQRTIVNLDRKTYDRIGGIGIMAQSLPTCELSNE